MFDDNSAAVEDFNNASLAGDDGAADRAASSPSLQRAVLGPALALAPQDADGNVRCASRHSGFECGGADAHDGIHWNGSLWWDTASADATDERAPRTTEVGDTMGDVLRGVERLIALRSQLTINPANLGASFNEILDELARTVGVPVPDTESRLDGVPA